MSAVLDTLNSDEVRVDDRVIQPFPRSRKIYAQGSRRDLRVPMREIACSDTPSSLRPEKNPPLTVYDTSGPYTDPATPVDIHAGLDRAPHQRRYQLQKTGCLHPR